MVEYGLTASYGSQTTPQTVSSSQPVDFSRTVFELACGAIYHFRIVAGTVAGADRTFATAICPAPGLSGGVQSLAVDPTNGQIVYAGSTDAP